jgi:hypothetical protein
MAQKNISVREETKKKLDSLKMYPGESYDGTITRIIEMLECYEREPFEFMGVDSKNKPQWRRKFKKGEVMVPASLLPGEKGYKEQQRERNKESLKH